MKFGYIWKRKGIFKDLKIGLVNRFFLEVEN